mmetsp:Transcript_24229/g.35234  ORF Transcript_24229/g.35234 Transcript_24229/m.35234 type:complete len:80 (-) Transcript_24229:339-578(-)
MCVICAISIPSLGGIMIQVMQKMLCQLISQTNDDLSFFHVIILQEGYVELNMHFLYQKQGSNVMSNEVSTCLPHKVSFT